MMNIPATTAQADAPPLTNDAGASAVGSSVLDSPHERAYGTFEVSVIDVDSESEHSPPLDASKPTAFATPDDDEPHHTCAGDCCAVVGFLWMPFRVDTYKIVVFHFVNALFAIGAAAWTIVLYALTLALSPIASVAQLLRNADAATLRVLLRADAVLFNFVSPRAERIRVYNSSTGTHDGYYSSAHIYFAIGKLVCSAVPGAVAALTFLWTIRNFVVVLTAGGGASTPDDPLASMENDVLILLALVAVYAAAGLTKVVAVMSRHITIFFCAEYLLYASSL